MVNELFRAAKRYQRLGWSVLHLYPSIPGDKESGKRPRGKWEKFESEKANEEQIESWWTQFPDSNVGLALGPISGLMRVDIDCAEADSVLRFKAGNNLPITLKFNSSVDNFGFQKYGLLFKIPIGVEIKTTKERELAIGELRIQSRGAQTVLPPSVHYTGSIYTWVDGCSPFEIEAVEMPQWLVDYCHHMRKNKEENPITLSDGKIPIGQRDDTLFKLGCGFRRKGLNEREIFDILKIINTTRCESPLEMEDLRRIANSSSKYQAQDDMFRRASHREEERVSRFGWVGLETMFVQKVEEAERLVDNLLVTNLATVFFSMDKTMKTCSMQELGLSLISGIDFCGTKVKQSPFKVPKPRNVLFISGESAQRTLEKNFQRYFAHKLDRPTASLEYLHKKILDCPGKLNFSRSVPHFYDKNDLEMLGEDIERYKSEVLLVDPALFVVPTNVVSNQPAVYEYLYQASTLCEKLGVTLICLLHTNKNLSRTKEPVLEDINFTGWQQWLRQYWAAWRSELYDEPEEKDQDKIHKVWWKTGSAEMNIRYHLEINEGSDLFPSWKIDLTNPKNETSESRSEWLNSHPNASDKEISSQFNVTLNYARQIRKRWKDKV